MKKLDLAKHYKAYYTARKEPELIEVQETTFLSITGKGDPSEQQYADHLQALYATAYTIKFMYKAIDLDFVVAKLEGLWSFDEQKYKDITIDTAATLVPRSDWAYRMMVRLPEYVTRQDVITSIQNVVAKKQIALANNIEIYTLNEGKVVQMLHTGPFDTEQETLLVMQQFMQKMGLKKNGQHHEIYLTDFNKTVPDKLRTILREPVK